MSDVTKPETIIADALGENVYDADEAARLVVDSLAARGYIVVPAALLRDLTDMDDCWFDHHGGCQAHGYSIEPGEICPQKQARNILEAGIVNVEIVDEVVDDAR